MPDNSGAILDDWDDGMGSIPDDMPIPTEGIVPLGHDRGVFYYLSRAAGQVYDLLPGQHGKAGLMAMASVAHYWEHTRHHNPKGGIKWDDAADELMCQCRDVGIYDTSRVRGRGAWMDNGRAVLHLGNRMVVDGRSVGLMLPGSRHVYEASQALIRDDAPPLVTATAHRLVSICQGLRWECPISGVLLAGFIAVAPICGGLSWRPSIWITGGSGSGKSWLKDNILAPALAGVALQVQSKTSEAGIRQTLGSDARPVLFDEAESEDQVAATRIQGVLDLVRQSSSDGGADIVKGGKDGRAMRYRIRSCFAFSSINASILHEADANRISILALRPPGTDPRQADANEAAFLALQQAVLEVITPGFAAGLVSRSVRLLPVIRINAERFANAVSLHLGSRRTGDQYGALLAGAYSLHSEREITAEDALAYVRKQTWEIVQDSEAEKDELRLLSHMTQHRIRIASGNGQHFEPTIGQAIEAAMGKDSFIPVDVASDELRRTGIKVASGDEYAGAAAGVWVSNTHPAIRRMMVGTPWAAGWSRPLLRLDSTRKSPNSLSFAFGHVAKAVWIPLATLQSDNPVSGKGSG